MQERRHERIRRAFQITWKDQNVGLHGVTLDICADGLFVITNEALPPNSMVDMEIRLENPCALKCRGKVVWVNRGQVPHYPPGFGVKFLDLSEEEERSLLSLLETHDREEIHPAFR